MADRKPVIAVDVDLTIVDSGQAWYDWLEANCVDCTTYEDMIDSEGNLPYNLAPYYTLPRGWDAFEFWIREDLYDEAVCYESSKRVLEHLYKNGWEIVFVSWCFGKGEHMESKHQMLRREYSFIDDHDFHFITTKSKYLVNCQFAVDDRNSFCNQYNEDVTVFKINTPYTQDEELTRPVFSVDSWNEIINLLEV